MKSFLFLLSAAVFAFAQDVENIPEEEAQKVARRIVDAFSVPADVPFTVDADSEKPTGLKAGDKAGLIVLPDKKLKSESIAAAGKEVTPVGQLWMYKVVPAVDGSAPDPAKLRSVEFGEDDQKRVVEVYYLGLTKKEDGTLELSLYAKDKAALVKVPLVKTDAAANTVPISVAGQKEGEDKGVLVITVFGSHKADVAVTKPRE